MDGIGLPQSCPWLVRQGKACGKPAVIQDWCRSHAADEADRRFRVLVKLRDPHCRARRNRECLVMTTDCAHIFTRWRWQTRWDPDNAVGLCRRCHAWYTDHPNQWEEWVITVVFEGDAVAYGHLDNLSTSTERGAPKVDLGYVLTRLEEVAYG